MHPLYTYIIQSLSGLYPDLEVKALAKGILTDVFGFSAVDLYAGKDRNFSTKEREKLEDILSRLKRFEPFQYITSETFFLGHPFYVTHDVLVPRPETAELVEWITRDYASQEGLRVLDIGTGSGCIAVSLARLLPRSSVLAWDVSEAALSVARRNAARNGVNVECVRVDVLSHIVAMPDADIWVSNPPYIREQEKASMDRNVLDWEPGLALFVPDNDPLLFYRKIAELGSKHLSSSGVLYYEINQAYGRETVELLRSMGYRNVELRKDLSGNDRMVKAERP